VSSAADDENLGVVLVELVRHAPQLGDVHHALDSAELTDEEEDDGPAAEIGESHARSISRIQLE
jgi:hypothetical protein